jgi:cysteine desulfurase family protein (TIGR01976 family)
MAIERLVNLQSSVSSVEEIRARFPALARRHRGQSVAYFDAPGGTQVPREVVEAMSGYLLEHNANSHWAYPTSEETDAIIAASRLSVADLLHASPREISFGANMTTITFHLARALGRTWQRGDEVIVTELDHHANIAPWRALEMEKGIVVRSARLSPETAQLDVAHLESLVGKKTRLLAIGAASNAVGTINDLRRLREIARASGALLFVDAVHLVPHQLVDVQEIGCDFLACSAYKFYGPHIGILFAREPLLQSLPFPKLEPAPDTAPDRAETGTQNHEGIAGVEAAINFLASLSGTTAHESTGRARRAPTAGTEVPRDLPAVGAETRRQRLASTFEVLHQRGARQASLLWDGLRSIPHVRVYGPPPDSPRTPTVSFTMEARSSRDVALALAEEALFVSDGNFYALDVARRLGVGDQGFLRVGCACYTTDAEVERLLEGVRRLTT